MTEGGHVLHTTASHAIRGDETEVAVRTAYIEIGKAAGVGRIGNQIQGTVRRRMFHGDFVQYVIDSRLGPIIVRCPPTNLVAESEAVDLWFSTEHCILLEG
jgi:hypothetical protein